MASYEGLINIAIKTNHSRYFQKYLIKHLEGLHIYYDHTVKYKWLSNLI